MGKGGGMRKYFHHLKANWKVAGRCLIMCCFHFMHGIIPLRITEHGFWGFGGPGIKVRSREGVRS
jgi:hypothetical protein